LHKNITISSEHDEKAFKALRDALVAQGAREVDREWGVGGSQEINTWTYEVGDQIVEVMSETYIGLSIGGDEQLVLLIAETVRQRLAKDKRQD
jgi:hypothetical protein